MLVDHGFRTCLCSQLPEPSERGPLLTYVAQQPRQDASHPCASSEGLGSYIRKQLSDELTRMTLTS